MTVQELTDWLCTHLDATHFPYARVVREVQRFGKHDTPRELLSTLDQARSMRARFVGALEDRRRLQLFLDNVLDRWDGTFCAPTYLALNVLPIPDPDGDVGRAWRQHDALLLGLLADVLAFETAAAHGETDLLPRMRPGPAVAAKRCRLSLRAMARPLGRLDIAADGAGGADLEVGVAERVCAAVLDRTSPQMRLAVMVSMLPVDRVHDEWMFIRVLQAAEAGFALAAAQLQTAVAVLSADNGLLAADHVDGATVALRQAALLFPLLATMQIEAFTTFRAYTEGASAIQSNAYKLVESLCRRPDQERLDSVAYRSVPAVRQRVLDGPPTLDDAYRRAAVGLPNWPRERVEQAMRRLADVIAQWRQTHYRLAMRMLGEQPGTGHTNGVSYLHAARTVPVFRSLPVRRRPTTGGAAGDTTCR